MPQEGTGNNLVQAQPHKESLKPVQIVFGSCRRDQYHFIYLYLLGNFDGHYAAKRKPDYIGVFNGDLAFYSSGIMRKRFIWQSRNPVDINLAVARKLQVRKSTGICSDTAKKINCFLRLYIQVFRT